MGYPAATATVMSRWQKQIIITRVCKGRLANLSAALGAVVGELPGALRPRCPIREPIQPLSGDFVHFQGDTLPLCQGSETSYGVHTTLIQARALLHDYAFSA